MPFSGNRLGPKAKYQYTADNGATYVLTLDPDLVVAGSGLVAGNVGQTAPKRFKPRVVFAQFIDAGKIYRKSLIAGTIDGALFASNTPQVVTIDGAAFTTTGRRGEQQTFG